MKRGSIARAVVLGSASVLALSSCGSSVSTPPEARAVAVTTTACGDASKTRGSGVIVREGMVLTAAHVVIGASTVMVDGISASVTAIDTTADLAVLTFDNDSASNAEVAAVELTELAADDDALIVGGLASGTVEATVRRRVIIDVDEVRGTRRVTREGYELDASIDGGDSGSGVFDSDGRLAGIVFAEPTQRDEITFAVASGEIQAILGVTPGAFACDSAASRLISTSSTVLD